MAQIDQLQRKVYYCPLKSNQQVDDSGGFSHLISALMNWSGRVRTVKAELIPEAPKRLSPKTRKLNYSRLLFPA